MTKITNGRIITQNLDGTDHLDCLYRVSIKALIYNDAGQILVVKEDGRPLWDLPGGGMDYGETFESALKRELYEEVGYKGNLRYQLFDASDEIYIERIDANQICFSCRVWTENFDFSAGVDADEVMFMDPEELRLQESESGAPLRYKQSFGRMKGDFDKDAYFSSDNAEYLMRRVAAVAVGLCLETPLQELDSVKEFSAEELAEAWPRLRYGIYI